MEEIISILTDGLIELRRTTSLNTDDIAKINAVLEELQSNQLSSQEIEKLVIILATGYFKTKNDDYDTMINELMAKITAENEAKLTDMINQSIEAFKSDLTAFKSTIKNGKDGRNGTDGIDGKDGLRGRDGKDGLNGKDGINGKDGQSGVGVDGIGISDITYKNGTLTVTLTDGTKKNIKLNIPTQYIGGGGGVSAEYVNTAIAEAIGGGYSGAIEKEIRIATQEPTGFDRIHPETMGIIELSPDGVNVLRIDHLGVFTMNASGKFGYGTKFETDASIRTLAIYPQNDTFSFWVAGEKLTYTTIKSIELSNYTGERMVYFDASGELREEFNDIANVFQFFPAVSSIYGNSTSQQKITFSDERHGIRMDGETHSYLHNTRGAQYFSGANINGLVATGTTYSSIDAGIFYDEDIKHYPQSRINTPFWFQRNTGWEILPDTNLLAHLVTGVAQYNPFTTEWILRPVANGKYALIHFFFTNDAQYPYVKILGQKQYDTKTLAKAGANVEINDLQLNGLPTLEFKALYSVIITYRGKLELTDEGELFVDFRRTNFR